MLGYLCTSSFPHSTYYPLFRSNVPHIHSGPFHISPPAFRMLQFCILTRALCNALLPTYGGSSPSSWNFSKFTARDSYPNVTCFGCGYTSGARRNNSTHSTWEVLSHRITKTKLILTLTLIPTLTLLSLPLLTLLNPKCISKMT